MTRCWSGSEIAEYLRTCGFKVIEAVNAGEAVLLGEGMRVDIVLGSVATQAADGFALSRWIREHRRGLLVILAGTPGRSVEAAAELCDTGPLLSRPYDPQIVLDRIRRLLAAQRRQDDEG